MKLRQKFAAVMATAMVVTAVPVITMAASSNTMTRPVKTVESNGKFDEATTAGGLQIKFTGAVAQGDNHEEEVFYLTLTNAEWNREAIERTFVGNVDGDTITLTENKYYHDGRKVDFLTSSHTASNAVGTTIKFESDTEIKVTIPNVLKDDVMVFPLLAQDIDGEAKVKVETKGSASTISEGEYVFATTAEKKLNFSIGDMTTVYEEGELADINFSETFTGAFNQTAEIEVELKDADYEFDLPSGKDLTLDSKYVKFSQGFSNASGINVTYTIDRDDKGVCIFKITAPKTAAKSIGKITLQNLPVRNDAKDITTGDLLADITNYSGSVLGNGATNVKVADITAYSNYITMKDSKPVDIVAGRIEKVEFVVGENITDSFGADREFELTLDNDAHFNYETGKTLYDSSKDSRTNDIVKDQTQVKVSGKMENIVESIKVDANDNNKLIVRLNDSLNKDTKDKMKLELEVCVPVAAKEEEKVTLTASGRALTADVSTTAVNIVNPFDVKMEALQVKVGLQNQVGGKVTISETEKEMFMKGRLELKVVDPATGATVDGIKFYNKNFVDYTTTGDIKKADLDTVNSNGTAAIEIKRQSSSASTLELKDFHVTVDRSVPEGKYDLVLTGKAIDEHNAHVEHKNSCEDNKLDKVDVHYTDEDQRDVHKITVKDFLVVGTPNTDDLAVNGLRKGIVEFKVGESKYTVNGKEVAMDAASYIQDPGFTMVPVRYVAESFGISSKDILFSSGGTVTIITGSRTVQLQNNSDIALVNGAQVKMGTKVVIKDGRTYAPIGEVAQILGVQKGWDNTTKTATFTN